MRNKATQAIIDDTLAVCREPVTADELFQNCAADGLPVSYHQCKTVAKLSEGCIESGGWYNILSRSDDLGNVITFFNAEGELTESITIRKPVVAANRKIPKLNWLKQWFGLIGYTPDQIEIKYIHRIIESHIRDGGTCDYTMNDHTLTVNLKYNDQTKMHLEFHREAGEL